MTTDDSATHQNERGMTDQRRQLPAWLWGLIFAIVLSVAALLIFSALGYGDNPVLEEGAAGSVMRCCSA